MSYAGVLNAGAEVDKVRRLLPSPPVFFASPLSEHQHHHRLPTPLQNFVLRARRRGGVMGWGGAPRASACVTP